jgi:hypothetical protein
MQLPGYRGHPTPFRWTIPLVLVVATATLGACSSGASPATKKAQTYAANSNLKLLDLPSGWSSQGTPTNSSGTVSTLSDTRAKSVNALLATLPTSCRVLDSTFKASLVGAPPVGSTAQNEAKFTSASDGNAQITSTVVVFGNLQKSQGTFGLYATPTFTQCLQGFLMGTLDKLFNLSASHVTVAVAPTATSPSGVQATAFTVSESGARSGSQTQVSVGQEVVMQSGKAVAFLQVGGAVTSLPVDALNVFNQSVSVVEHRLVVPPS